MTNFLRARGGIPRFARKVMAGEPATIVAFGSSLTLHSRCGLRVGGRYLDALLATIQARTGNSRINLVNVGLEGFTSTWAAHRVHSDVLPHAPDLVTIEFAHNDNGLFVESIPGALDGIVAQIREAYPACEFGFVLLARGGAAALGPSPAMAAYEVAADLYGFPSFDLATLGEQLVAAGKASWTGDPRTALTLDGSHPTELATPLIGEPFAEAFAELLDLSLRTPEAPPVLPSAPPAAQRARRSSLLPFVDDRWTVGAPVDEIHCRRTVAAYRDEIAFASVQGATAAFAFTGTSAQLWVLLTGGAIRIVVDGAERWSPIEKGGGEAWGLVDLAINRPDDVHTVELNALELPLVLGDVFVIGEFIRP